MEMCWNTKSSTHLPREGVLGSPIKSMHVTLETTPIIIYSTLETASNESNLLIGLNYVCSIEGLLIWIKSAITQAERNMAMLTSVPPQAAGTEK